jgi:hypothetical protein
MWAESAMKLLLGQAAHTGHGIARGNVPVATPSFTCSMIWR